MTNPAPEIMATPRCDSANENPQFQRDAKPVYSAQGSHATMSEAKQYQMSFVTGSLFLVESRRVAEVWRESRDWEVARERVLGDNLLQKRTAASSSRVFREIRHRLSCLTARELDLLVDGDFQEQRQMTYLATCKFYAFVREFVIEVVREKVLLLDCQLASADFNRFVEYKSIEHPELDGLSEKSLAKSRQVVFRILTEAGCLESTKTLLITPPLLSRPVIDAVADDDALLLKVFLMSDRDTQLREQEYGE
jgi:hypothetical protein